MTRASPSGNRAPHHRTRMSSNPHPPPPEPKSGPRYHKKPRARGQVTTSDVIYTDPEAELLAAVERWKKLHKVKFPTVTQIFAVILSLGYTKPGGK